MTDHTTRRRIDDDQLAPYLVHHLLAAGAGVQSFRAAVWTWRGTEEDREMRRLADDVAADHRDLAALVRHRGYRVPPVRGALGVVAAVGARLGALNPLRRRGTQAGQMELEALESAVDMKESLWDTLLALPADALEEVADRASVQRLQERAQDQRVRLARVRRRTAPARFLRS